MIAREPSMSMKILSALIAVACAEPLASAMTPGTNVLRMPQIPLVSLPLNIARPQRRSYGPRTARMQAPNSAQVGHVRNKKKPTGVGGGELQVVQRLKPVRAHRPKLTTTQTAAMGRALAMGDAGKRCVGVAPARLRRGARCGKEIPCDLLPGRPEQDGFKHCLAERRLEPSKTSN